MGAIEGMKTLPFRVRKQFFDRIVAGTKTVEYRSDSPFWSSRARDAAVALFICGRRTHRRLITGVERVKTPAQLSPLDVDSASCLCFSLGQEVSEGKSLG